MNHNCKHLKCSLGRADVMCSPTCFARKDLKLVEVPKVATPITDTEKDELKAKVVELTTKIAELTAGSINPIKEVVKTSPQMKHRRK